MSIDMDTDDDDYTPEAANLLICREAYKRVIMANVAIYVKPDYQV
jgi:hypothetical protein